LFDLVDLVEPVPSFVKQAKKNALRASEHGWTSLREGEGAPAGERKAVRIWKAGLQHFDPTCPGKPVDATKGSVELFAQVGRDEPSWASSPPGAPRELNVQEEGYDLIMIQWCIGTLPVQIPALLCRQQPLPLTST
jgi:protein N-terminal methyltransferase